MLEMSTYISGLRHRQGAALALGLVFLRKAFMENVQARDGDDTMQYK